MLSVFQSCAIIAGSIALALVCLLIFRRFWLPRGRRQHNDVIGWQISFLGTTYAVIIAFMLSDVWNNFVLAETNAEIESNALLNVYRVAAGLPSPPRDQVQALAHRYGEVMIREEWPAMMKGAFSSTGSRIISALWDITTKVDARNASEQVSLERLLTDLTSMTEHRRIRQFESRSKIPDVFWLLLITGGVLTVLYACLFDVEETRMHVLQVVGITFIVSLVLVTIADVDGPYGGALRIQPTGFVMALKSMGDAIGQQNGAANQ